VVGITTQLGLESILAAFTVGVIRGMTEERDEGAEQKREAVALGIFVPFFFVSSGLNFQLDQLFATIGGVIRLPVFVIALLAVHVLPALLYRRTMGTRMADRPAASHHGAGDCDRPGRRRVDLGGGLPGDRLCLARRQRTGGGR
jgi:Kef-type K+ transport system membrane component KefB